MQDQTPAKIGEHNWIRKEVVGAIIASFISLTIIAVGINGCATRIGSSVEELICDKLPIDGPVRKPIDKKSVDNCIPKWLTVVWRRVVSPHVKLLDQMPSTSEWIWDRVYTAPNAENSCRIDLNCTQAGDCYLLFDREVLIQPASDTSRKPFTFYCGEADWATGPGWHGYVEPQGFNFAHFVLLDARNRVIKSWYARVDSWQKADSQGIESRHKYPADHSGFLARYPHMILDTYEERSNKTK